jgi:hypothetical protein
MNNVANDVNGNFYVTGQQGELEEDKEMRHFIIPKSVATYFQLGTAVDQKATWFETVMRTIIRANFWFLRSLPDPVTVEEAAKIAWLRVCGLLLGLADLADNHADHNLIYNDTKVKDIGNHGVDHNPDTRSIRVIDMTGIVRYVHPYEEDVPLWDTTELSVWRNTTWRKFSNILCIVAYFMRTRAHHWTEDMQVRYVEVWRNCLYDEDDIGLKWELVAHHALHYIYPNTLDQFWTESVRTKRCAGALIKRYTSYPAGMAAVGAVWAGYRDLTTIFPKFQVYVKDAVKELDKCRKTLLDNRWAGSINRRYYNAPDVKVNEAELASLAATIISALEATGAQHALASSSALKRVAGFAPITGSFMVNVLKRAAGHAAMVHAVLPEEGCE